MSSFGDFFFLFFSIINNCFVVDCFVGRNISAVIQRFLSALRRRHTLAEGVGEKDLRTVLEKERFRYHKVRKNSAINKFSRTLDLKINTYKGMDV